MSEVCKDCRGSGIAYSEYHPLSNDHEHIRCELCDGFGTEQDKPMTKKPTSAEIEAAREDLDNIVYGNEMLGIYDETETAAFFDNYALMLDNCLAWCAEQEEGEKDAY